MKHIITSTDAETQRSYIKKDYPYYTHIHTRTDDLHARKDALGVHANQCNNLGLLPQSDKGEGDKNENGILHLK